MSLSSIISDNDCIRGSNYSHKLERPRIRRATHEHVACTSPWSKASTLEDVLELSRTTLLAQPIIMVDINGRINAIVGIPRDLDDHVSRAPLACSVGCEVHAALMRLVGCVIEGKLLGAADGCERSVPGAPLGGCEGVAGVETAVAAGLKGRDGGREGDGRERDKSEGDVHCGRHGPGL